MEIEDLKPNQKVYLEGVEIIEVGEIFQGTSKKTGQDYKVQALKVKDETGEANISLWNKETGNFAVSEKISVLNGFCKYNNHQGRLEVTTGKLGKIHKHKVDINPKK